MCIDNRPNPHKSIIEAWSKGADVQWRPKRPDGWKQEEWMDIDRPGWERYNDFRIKPKAVKEQEK